jgi:Holliday junction DNA helicase RuvA
MIGKLTGRIDVLEEDHLILDVNGVGYVVFCSAKTLAMLGGLGSNAGLVIETHVREDHIHLYGFANAEEREWFRTLTGVQGVGVRMGLAILSVFGPQELATIIGAQDKKALTAVSGVGPKLAERIITELKNKVAKMPSSAFTPSHETQGAKAAGMAAPSGLLEDATSALTHLGYARSEAFTAASRVLHTNPDSALDDVIKTALQHLAA